VNIFMFGSDAGLQSVLRKWLEGWGHRVTAIVNVEDAWACLQQGAFDVVLGSLESESFAGLKLCRMIREDPKLTSLYIILYSAEPEELVSVLNADVDDFLAFPLEQMTVRVRIRAALRTLKLRRMLVEQNANLNNLVQKLGTAFSSIESDLRAASEMQVNLLPTISDIHPRYRVEWLVLPRSFLTGDNLNYYMLQERYLTFYHLDVAGHGIPSALLSVTLSQLLSPQPGSPMVRFDPKLDMKRIVPPMDVVSELNRRFVGQNSGYFTIIYGVLDTKTGEITFCQAGHPSPLVVGENRSIRSVGDGGFPVGLWPGMTYEETTFMLGSGERFVLYSDGLLECVSPEGVPYTLDKLRQHLILHAKSPVKEVLQTLREDLEGWSRGGSFQDDISLLIIESK
jgi:sigma-B regulation protein RsbU (phosphoserine phosphatase)